ncbi:MAG TPA: hypothetical protein VMX54_13340 [Vicinamibacteria bacterium]|nr:hypothetical protein [Vicinamibacteria bacterium]
MAVEVFSVGLAAGEDVGLRFARQEAPLVEGRDPDPLGRSLATRDSAAIAAIHSTSWRWEGDGRIVLTYVAWIKEGRLGADALPLPPLTASGPTDPLHPRPAQIRELDPLAHGLRHLAFLVQQDHDGALRRALGARALTMLHSFEPTVAGELR